MPDDLQFLEQTAEKYRDERDLLLEQRDSLFIELSDLKLRHAKCSRGVRILRRADQDR